MTIGGWTGYVLLLAIIIAGTVMICMVCETVAMKIVWSIGGVILSIIVLAGFLFYFNCTESGKRELKTEKSNLHGGIERTVTVYDYNGNRIDSWTGTFDATNSEYETYFDINGKRVVIHGGIVINEEQ